MRQQLVLILPPPPLHTQPLGCGLHPSIHHPLIRQQGTGLISQHVVTRQCPLPPFDHKHKYIHTPKWHFSH